MKKTILTWKKRVSRKRKALVTEIIRCHYPDAEDKGEAIEMTAVEPGKLVWLFMLSRDFVGIATAKRRTVT